MQKQYFVYIMTNRNDTVLYTGMTNNLQRRVYEHKNKIFAEFTSRYQVHKLIYYEIFIDSYNAIAREKQIKAGSRRKKIQLVESINPNWIDLSEYLGGGGFL
jgi:putative endonuclease